MLTPDQKSYIRKNLTNISKKQIASDINASYHQVMDYCQCLYRLGYAPHRQHQSWTPSQCSIVAKIYAEPLPFDEKLSRISKRTGHPINSVRSQIGNMKRRGYTMTRVSISKYDSIKDELIRDYTSLVKMSKMMQKYNLPDYTIRRIAHKHGAHRVGYFKNTQTPAAL